MNKQTFQIGTHQAKKSSDAISATIVHFDGDAWYRISNYREMAPFLMSIVSASDLWLFMSSSGGLTAGRRSPDTALFPYYTDDKIHDSAATTGSRSTFFIEKAGTVCRWEPFSAGDDGLYPLVYTIYKNQAGSKVCFEVVNEELALRFRVTWRLCERYGIIRTACLENLGENTLNIELLDGIVNILPAGIDRKVQNELSTLLDGYKKNERVSESSLALYTMSSLLTDKAEPAESLKATVVWSAGLSADVILLSEKQIRAFRHGADIQNEQEAQGQRGAYLLQSMLELGKGEIKRWYIAADLNYDHSQVKALQLWLENDAAPEQKLQQAMEASEAALRVKIGKADGYQMNQDEIGQFRHSSVTLFNIMRGGLFENGYHIPKADFIRHLQHANNYLAKGLAAELDSLPEMSLLPELFHLRGGKNSDVQRLVYEYLPLSFSRRHGDPSRPWNDFAIETKDAQGNEKYHYQGNWRDIFQNWEALALSYPEFIEHFIVKFLNASTADGYNPYRLTRDGFDWEAPEPDSPWSNIGYWGDHQIVYLYRLLRLSTQFHPGRLREILNEKIFVYADLPYHIVPYEQIVQDPHNTIEFDAEKDHLLRKHMAERGSDGALLQNDDGSLHKAGLGEKLLLTLLVKFSNFVPEAGIWMNTQRPEWNDANNALVGFGASVVTTAQLRPYILWLLEMTESLQEKVIILNDDICRFFRALEKIFQSAEKHLPMPFADEDRKAITDALGKAGSDYRLKLYQSGLTNVYQKVNTADISAFLKTALRFINHTLSSNRRDDLLFHSYNLITYSEKGIAIRRLYEMLEAQVAILDSEFLSTPETVSLLNALRKSELYRPDQDSYLLYPERKLPHFMEKNTIPKALIQNAPLLQELIEEGEIIHKDSAGNCHFDAEMSNGRKLEQVLRILKPDADEAAVRQVLNIYETIFDHQSFTGRSGTFYKYEGLGSVYWHMVAKLLLAVGESFFRGVTQNADKRNLAKLKAHYYAIQRGLGAHKNPAEHGAFPTDPYSHTPKNSGAQQPGMTGLTKEEILSRIDELGVRIQQGKIEFLPLLLCRDELLTKSGKFYYIDLEGREQWMRIPARSTAFTLAQTPIVIIPSRKASLLITMNDGSRKILNGNELEAELSATIFRREGKIKSIEVRCLIPTDKKNNEENRKTGGRNA